MNTLSHRRVVCYCSIDPYVMSTHRILSPETKTVILINDPVITKLVLNETIGRTARV